MGFSDLVEKYRAKWQSNVDKKVRELWELATPITAALKEYGKRYRHKFQCNSNSFPYKITLYIKKPKVRIEITSDGYTLYESHTTPWSYLYMSDLGAEHALDHLASILAKSKLKTPCK